VPLATALCKTFLLRMLNDRPIEEEKKKIKSHWFGIWEAESYKFLFEQ
jgi:hypothetical protein